MTLILAFRRPAMAALLLACLPTFAAAGWPWTPSRKHWGQYGYGPHFRRTHHHQPDFGPPYFTLSPGRHIPFSGHGTNWSGAAPYYGPYSGAPPVSDAVPPPPPSLPSPDDPPTGVGRDRSPFAPATGDSTP